MTLQTTRSNFVIAQTLIAYHALWYHLTFHCESIKLYYNHCHAFFFSIRRHRLKGIHSRSDTNRTGLYFYYPRLLHCLNQMLAVVLLSQHRVSSSKTVRPRAPCGSRCIGHLLVHGLRFAQRRHTRNSVKERDSICAWTNEIAQHQSAGG